MRSKAVYKAKASRLGLQNVYAAASERAISVGSPSAHAFQSRIALSFREVYVLSSHVQIDRQLTRVAKENTNVFADTSDYF